MKNMLVTLIDAVNRREGARKAISSSLWLYAENLLRTLVGVVAAIWVARYLGPEQYGLLTSSVAVMAVVGAASTLGMDNTVVKACVERPGSAGTYLATALVLRLVAGIVGGALAIVLAMTLRPDDQSALIVVLILSLIPLFRGAQVMDLYYQATSAARVPAIVRSIATIGSAIFKIVMILVTASLPMLAFATLLEWALMAIGMGLMWYQLRTKIQGWRFSREEAIRLTKESWPLLITAITVMIYMKIDVILLAYLKGDRSAGIYSAAARLSEILYIVPVALSTALFPAMVKAANAGGDSFSRRSQTIADVTVAVSLVASAFTVLLAPFAIKFLFGSRFDESKEVLMFHAWTTVFVAFVMIREKWLVAQGLQRYGTVLTVVGALLSVVLNLVLIPIFGAVGAAVASLICYFVSAFLFCFLLAPLRPLGRIFIKSLWPFGRLAADFRALASGLK